MPQESPPDVAVQGTDGKPRRLTGIVIALASVALIAAGLLQLTGGLRSLFSGFDRSAVSEIVKESDAALAEGAAATEKADGDYQALVQALIAADWSTFRDENNQRVQEIADILAEATNQFRLSAEQLDDAIALDMPEDYRRYLTLKRDGRWKLVEVYQLRRDAILALIDESLATKDDVIARFNTLGAQAEDAMRASAELSSEAEELASTFGDR